MARSFKLSGNTEARFKQLELIIPRMFSRMGSYTYAIVPASVVSGYKEIVQPGEVIFSCVMFAGKIKKVLFKLGFFDGKNSPKYEVRILTDNEQRVFKAETKKLSHIMEMDMKIEDGALLEIVQVDPEVVLHNIYLSAMIEFDKKYNETKTFVTEELEKDMTNERI